MKKIILLLILLTLGIFCTACVAKASQMPNPWTDCKSLDQAAKVAGFKFPFKIPNSVVRAMNGMVEVIYPQNGKTFTVRKSTTKAFGEDISGDYNTYPVNKKMTLKSGAVVNVRGDTKQAHVMYFTVKKATYSASCDKGMSQDEVNSLYDAIMAAEAK